MASRGKAGVSGVCGKVAIERLRKKRRHCLRSGKGPYRIDVASGPINRSIELVGPGNGLRWLRQGSHDFSSFAELAKTIAQPGMSDLEKALAVYRFSFRHTTHGGMGWGSTEMTRFLNAFGYSFCWGQADFQHLLYEAVGLRARAPGLKGHSSVEVLIEGRWCMLDAFMQLVLPSPELDGVATGQELMENPWIFDAARSLPERVKVFKDYWSGFSAHDGYEPWQDSRLMVLNLRRGERLKFDYGRRETWCVAPGEPPDYVNGKWTWQAKLDEQHLKSETDLATNVTLVKGGLGVGDEGESARVEYRVRSPYPFCCGANSGGIALKFAGKGAVKVAISTDQRKTWADLYDGPACKIDIPVDDHMSPTTLPDIGRAPHDALRKASVCDVLLRVEWCGGDVLRSMSLDFIVQANSPSIPQLSQGANMWSLETSDAETAITHHWDEFPGMTVSNERPYEGEEITIKVAVHNRSASAVKRVPVRFVVAGTNVEIGRTVVSSIKARGSAQARITWNAEITPDRGNTGRTHQPRRYVNSIIEARVGDESKNDETSGEWSGDWGSVARAVVTVRPRPLPRMVDQLVWSSDQRYAHEQKVVVRAAVVNEVGRDIDQRLTYVPDSPLAVTLTPYLGHPDKGGHKLAESVRLAAVQPTEFEVAQWTLSTEALPKRFDVWIEAVSDAPVAAEHQRQLARCRVKV